MKRALAVAAALAFTAASYAQQPKLSKKALQALALTPDHFAKTAEVKDDEMELVATINTSLGLQDKKGLLKIVWDDNFLRAFIDKRTGIVKYQLYQRIVYTGPSWRFYDTVNFDTPEGLKSSKLTEIARDVDCSGSRYVGCTYFETVGFDVDQTTLETLAAAYQPNVPAGWRFRFKSRAGVDWDDGMLPAEAAGMLQAVAAYKGAHNLK